MNSSFRYFTVLVVSSFLLLPTLLFAEVKIGLKNGRTIIADICKESGTSLSCSKMGGTFDIDKKDIEKIEEMSVGSGTSDSFERGPDTSQEQEKKEGGKIVDGDRAKEAPGGAAGRLEEIRKRKAEMAAEREKLLKERERLQEDVKKAPDWMPVKRYEELQKRNSELDEQIKKYNDEVGRLNREEKDILDGSKKKKD